MISPNNVQKTQLKIGLFTDTYRPTVNGISVVVDTLKRQMEAAGHQAVVVCPMTYAARKVLKDEPNVITAPSIKGWPYDEYDVSFFWPPKFRKRLLAEKFDVILFFTPGQLGLMAMDIAHHANIPVVAQHSTDLEEYVSQYMGGPVAALAVLLGLPLFAGLKTINWSAWRHTGRPQWSLKAWGTQVIHEGLGMWYAITDGVIALSRKSKQQILAMPYVNTDSVGMIPVGVDPLPQSHSDPFRKMYEIPADAPLLMYVGRISREKNLDCVIPMMEQIIKTFPEARFAFVGDFDYRKKLEQKAHVSVAAKNIIFTGKISRDKLASVYTAADIFVFPSTTDTQGLVLHEAALCGLPIVMTDGAVTEIVHDGTNGYVVDNDPAAFAQAAMMLIKDKKLRKRFAASSIQIAGEYSEAAQTNKLLMYIQSILAKA
jgi:glycosyltransferase involved in cell wall biosynthesis